MCDGHVLNLPTIEDLSLSVLANNREKITIQKPEIAIKKLALILTGALELSNSKGFHAMSLRDLSRASGVSMGGLYSYIDSKTSLLKMILGEVTATVRRILEHPPEAVTENSTEHLLWLIDTHLRMTEAMLPWFIFAFMEAKNFPVSERRIAIESEELTESYFSQVLERGIAEGTFASTTPPLLSTLIKPLLQDWYVKRKKYHRRGVDIETYISTVQGIITAACGADIKANSAKKL